MNDRNYYASTAITTGGGYQRITETSVADPDPHSTCSLDSDPVSECRLGSSDFDKIFENCFASYSFRMAKDI
jgi:hypothetical protein